MFFKRLTKTKSAPVPAPSDATARDAKTSPVIEVTSEVQPLAAAELRRLERAGVRVYGIGIGLGIGGAIGSGDIPARYAPRGFAIGGPEELVGALLRIVEEEALGDEGTQPDRTWR